MRAVSVKLFFSILVLIGTFIRSKETRFALYSLLYLSIFIGIG